MRRGALRDRLDAPLIIEGMSWSRAHGDPFVILRAQSSDKWLRISCEIEQARASRTSQYGDQHERCCLARLAIKLVMAVGGQIEEIMLQIDEERRLSAQFTVRGAYGAEKFCAAPLDALLVADELGLIPLMRQEDVAQVTTGCHELLRKTESFDLFEGIQDFLIQLEKAWPEESIEGRTR